MIKIQFAVVPPGGGETDYQFEMQMAEIPQPGDYVFKRDPDGDPESRVMWCAFTVRRRWLWSSSEPIPVLVELEPARYVFESAAHRQTCDRYAGRGKPLQEIQASCY